MINIYRNEDKKYGVEYEDGILLNKERPINPKTSYSLRKQEKLINDEVEKMRMRNTKRSKNTMESFFSKSDPMRDGMGSEKNSTNGLSNGKNEYATMKDFNIYRSEDFIESYLNQKIAEITKTFDLRETIFSIFYRVGFNNITISTSEDNQTFVMIKNYPIFRSLENWKDLVQELDDTVKIKVL